MPHQSTKQSIRGLVEHSDFDGFLYHVTARSNINRILEYGLNSGSYWGLTHIVSYYAETIEDEGEEPLFIKLPIEAFDDDHIEPDINGIYEPLTFTLGMSEDSIIETWESGEGRWFDCLNLIGSVRYMSRVLISKSNFTDLA